MGGTKYLKYFETHSEYQTYINSQDKILPNVSYCENENEVHYNPWTDPRIIAKFNVTSTSSATNIMGSSATSQFSEIEIDGVVQPSVVSSYTFDTTGEHIVKYTLLDTTTIGENAFYNCTGLTSITIPNSVTTISNFAFRNCTGLTSITMPNSVTSIGQSAFRSCSGLTSVTIPDSLTTIGNYAFNGCTGLTSITMPNSVTSIGQSAFRSCSGLTSVTIPNSVTTIGDYVFYGCTGLTSVGGIGSGASIEIPNSITTIGYQTFYQCTGLTSITIPNSVTSIGNDAFRSCSGLTSVTIPNSVTTIGNYVFSNCTSLTSITSLATTAPTIQNTTFQSINTGGTLYVPTGSTGYDVWMGTGNYYLGLYTWTKVEQ